ncbi:MAG: aminoacyl-tRNA hydrolase [Candidatus Anstonellales archaeon]
MLKQAIVINSSLRMGKGKIAAHAAHASLQAYLESPKSVSSEWLSNGAKKVVLKAREEEMLDLFRKAKAEGLTASIIYDAGFTQVPAGSLTAIAIGPNEEVLVDKICGHLKLV